MTRPKATRCELFTTLWVNCPEFKRFALMNEAGPFSAEKDIERHHIWGGTARIDLPANLIDLCNLMHGWIHHRPIEGRIACLWQQMDLGRLDWSELDRCAGKSARGWVESQSVEGIDQWFQTQLLKSYQTQDRGR